MTYSAVVARVAAAAVVLATVLSADLEAQVQPKTLPATVPQSKRTMRPAVPTPAELPAPTLSITSSTPAATWLAWTPVPGVASYVGTRWQGTVVSTQVKFTAGETVWLDLGFRPATAYSYVLDAIYPDGRKASTELRLTTPPAVNPTGLVASQTRDGQVQLAWKAVPGVSYYMVFGPGSSFGGVRAAPASSPSYTVTGVPVGAQVWNVGSYYDPEPSMITSGKGAGRLAVSTPGAEFPSAKLTATSGLEMVPAKSTAGTDAAQFQVVANGFRVVSATKDDPNSLDGKGDEVFASFASVPYNRQTGVPTNYNYMLGSFGLKSSHVLGDVNLQPGRERAGTMSAAGGLKTGDVFPYVIEPSLRNSAPVTDKSFPMLVWKGTLVAGGDAVLIYPSMWEWDGATASDAEALWYSNLNIYQSQTWSDPEVKKALLAARLAIVTAGSTPATVERSATGSRPIGMQGYGLPRRVLVLTREVVMKAFAAAGNNATSVTIEIPFLDAPDPTLQGSYVLYLQVERLP